MARDFIILFNPETCPIYGKIYMTTTCFKLKLTGSRNSTNDFPKPIRDQLKKSLSGNKSKSNQRIHIPKIN